MTLEPKAGFDWRKVTWGRPDAIVSVLCSYCSASFSDGEVPLMMWDQRQYCAKFCTDCQRRWWGLESFEEDE